MKLSIPPVKLIFRDARLVLVCTGGDRGGDAIIEFLWRTELLLPVCDGRAGRLSFLSRGDSRSRGMDGSGVAVSERENVCLVGDEIAAPAVEGRFDGREEVRVVDGAELNAGWDFL